MLEPTAMPEEMVRRIVREEVDRAMKADPATRKMAILASKGTLDLAYPPLILATTGAAAGMDVCVFFTFYGLNIIHRDFEQRLRVSPVGNPAMPLPVPMPSLLTAMPGMEAIATGMMKSMFREKRVASVRELVEAALELDVRLVACRMTMEVFGFREEDFLDGVQFGGAAAFVSEARRAHFTMCM